ncbi:hypothetical protein IEQ34_022454 [Dendrobium chrysotoxum]|uniref:Uncharacterized protein n=1 Tax=Dendrobium chrysotoxum TaxID=161865 RepID=A0AAV7FZ21_DENCH|nr:hypothetical protein IEQ34_022454 [Dendrobium chrysotoxum]
MLDPRHVLIKLSNDMDYSQVFAHRESHPHLGYDLSLATLFRLITPLVASIIVELDITKKSLFHVA